MKEIRSIVNAYRSIDFATTRAALATVVRVEGSSYRRAGARMLVLDNGTYLGGISGGCLEGDALRRAQKAIGLRHASVVTYDTTQDDDHQVGVGLGCQGIIDVLFTPLDPDDANNPVPVLASLSNTRTPVCLITVTQGPRLGFNVLFEPQSFVRTFPFPGLAAQALPDIHDCLASLQSRTHTYSTDITLFIEMILPPIHVVVFGSNNDLYPFLRMALELGWDTSLYTNILRADKALLALTTATHDHSTDTIPEGDAYTAIVLMTHDYKTDLRRLPQALKTKASYIGILGPRKRTERIYAALEADGYPVSDADRQRVYSPAGLDIGSATPEEIALSILAEIRSHFAGRTGTSLRLRQGAIYQRQ
ncbi:XdhC family protein [Flavitalea sp. BT771]|uniref:XdhC family protein n=1 Tax=Flavitalea sp. BT771 TaxID=3063329 RepID=UPI0026E28900|nr:XdhC family protein [Flavitalea sp. BT771]MDO6430528.1 XdhC family protein [Flavitalea sp. BT771]MDV6219332.1 XdhC family protein [Flavitalea sp. BT771]